MIKILLVTIFTNNSCIKDINKLRNTVIKPLSLDLF
jgi:hypothetical protein